MIYAISDEIHQIFVPGRGPQVADVVIDSARAIAGIAMYMLIVRIVKNF
ncbi:VanZ family protein [Bacillus sp. JJ1566]